MTSDEHAVDAVGRDPQVVAGGAIDGGAADVGDEVVQPRHVSRGFALRRRK